MKFSQFFFCLFLLLAASGRLAAVESLARPVPLVPAPQGCSLEEAATYSVISCLPENVLLDQLPHILSQMGKFSPERIMDCSLRQIRIREAIMRRLRKDITAYRNRMGRSRTTYQESKLYAIIRKFGLSGYVHEKMQFIATRKMAYDESLVRLSIDNNVPVILLMGKQVLLCVAYNDLVMVMVDMAKVKGRVHIPGEWYGRYMLLKSKDALSNEERTELAGYQDIYDRGDYLKTYEISYFCHDDLSDFSHYPHIMTMPHESVKGEMILFAPPKLDVDRLMRRW